MIVSDLHYGWPHAVYLILLALLSLLFSWLLYRHQSRLIFSKDIIISRSPLRYWIKAAFYSLTFVFCTFALMWPIGNGTYPEQKLLSSNSAQKATPIQLKRKAHDLILLIDASASMSATDTRPQKSRLEYAKAIADEVISSSTGEQLALYAFTSETLQLSPLTPDAVFIRLMLNNITIDEGDISGTNIDDALLSINQSFQKKMTPSLKTLILFSDGEDTTIPNKSNEEILAKAHQLFENIIQYRLRIYTVGLGTSEGSTLPQQTDEGKPVISKLNEALLQSIARRGRGRFFNANRYSPTEISKAIYEDIAQDPTYYQEDEKEIESSFLSNYFGESRLIYDRYFQIPLALGVLCLCIAFFLPNRIRVLALLFLINDLAADELLRQPEMAKAKGYVEAYMYDEARLLYESLLNPSLPYKQKAILSYDIGTTYLLQRLWSRAVNEFEEIDLLELSWPFLEQKIHHNLALAYLGEALELKEKSIGEAFRLLKLSLKESKKSDSSDAALTHMINQEIDALLKEYPKELAERPIDLEWLQQASAKANDITSTEILKILIDYQEYTSDLITEAIQQNSAAFKKIQEFEQAIIAFSGHFLTNLYEEQVKNYQTGICQASPWEQVIPEFQAGLADAERANLHLQKNQSVQGSKYSGKAVSQWHKALSLILNPADEISRCFKNTPEGTQNFSNFLQMNLEDKRERIQLPVIGNAQSKPW